MIRQSLKKLSFHKYTGQNYDKVLDIHDQCMATKRRLKAEAN